MNKPISSEQREKLFQEWSASGLSKKEFCTRKQINYQTFIWWFSKKESRSKTKAAFLPVTVADACSDVHVEIHLSDSRRVFIKGSVAADLIRTILQC